MAALACTYLRKAYCLRFKSPLVRKFIADSCTVGLLYSKPKTNHKMLADLLMDCQVLTWVIHNETD